MLQISTGKFFEYDAWETPRLVVYFSNYRRLAPESIETEAGSLQFASDIGELGSLTAEITERLQKIPGGPFSGEITATSGDTLINDFAAVVSFALSISFDIRRDMRAAQANTHRENANLTSSSDGLIRRSSAHPPYDGYDAFVCATCDFMTHRL
jgi:hypothetical protein